MKINRLKIINFRNHAAFEIAAEKNIIAITGNNGLGKTNILEALSMLIPGKGFRGAKLDELQKQGIEIHDPWSIYAEIEHGGEITKIGTGFAAQKFFETGIEKRITRIDGEKTRGQNSLSEHVSMIWLTPSEDHTFHSGTAAREFLDRICEIFFPDYDSLIGAYNNFRTQRRKLLLSHRYDELWLNSLETQMAGKALAISYCRMEVLERINKAMALTANSSFPAARVEISGEIEDILKTRKATAAESEYIELLRHSRLSDAYTGRTSYGPHRTKLLVTHIEKNQSAELCSTGEQKAMLLSITLASCVAKRSSSGIAPIILLDEIIAHLDREKRARLLQFLVDINAQVWATGVDSADFQSAGDYVQHVKL